MCHFIETILSPDCPAGTWGSECSGLCNCLDASTVCDGALGCLACPDGWDGPACDQDIDECLQNVCQQHTTCVNIEGDFRCDCDTGYTLYTKTECTGRYRTFCLVLQAAA